MERDGIILILPDRLWPMLYIPLVGYFFTTRSEWERVMKLVRQELSLRRKLFVLFENTFFYLIIGMLAGLFIHDLRFDGVLVVAIGASTYIEWELIKKKGKDIGLIGWKEYQEHHRELRKSFFIAVYHALSFLTVGIFLSLMSYPWL